jgi:hypothetical protein
MGGRGHSDHSEGKEASDGVEKAGSDGSEGSEASEKTSEKVQLPVNFPHNPICNIESVYSQNHMPLNVFDI